MLLELKTGTVGPGDAVGIGDIGSALNTGANVELPREATGICDMLGC